jgi:hypothetical protein
MRAFTKLLAAVSVVASAASARADMVTKYWISADRKSVEASTCGVTTPGCFVAPSGRGITLGGFGFVCALAAGPTTKTLQSDGSTTFSRRIAIMDRGAKPGASATLSIYEESSNANRGTAAIGKPNKVTLWSVTGGPSAICSLARNGAGFYAGTNRSNNAMLVDDKFVATPLPGASPPIPVVGITVSSGGEVLVAHKGVDPAGGGESSAYSLFTNEGKLLQHGGGPSFLLVGAGNGVRTTGF